METDVSLKWFLTTIPLVEKGRKGIKEESEQKRKGGQPQEKTG